MATHRKRFTGVPRQLLARDRVYMLAWCGNRWEVVAESHPLVDGGPGGAPDAPGKGASPSEALGVSWDPITPEEIRERSTGAWSSSSDASS